MNYPDDFNTRTFPAGKSIAVSRAMGVGILSAFVVIVCLCGLLLWTIRSVRVEPYIIATGGINDRWNVIMAGNDTVKMTDVMVFQQSLVWKFTRTWFNISPNSKTNDAVWNTRCNRGECLSGGIGERNCALFCSAGDDLFQKFAADTLPQYREYESAGATWWLVPESVRIYPIDGVSTDGGKWRISATILTGGTGAMDIVAYVAVERNEKLFPATRGYYIADFNAYRLNQ